MSKKRYGNITIPNDPPESPSFVAIIILFAIPELITKAVGGYLLYKRIKNESTRRRYQMYRRYASAIVSQGREEISIRDLAATLGVSTSAAVSDIQAMIDGGMIPGSAYIDRSHMRLYMEGAPAQAGQRVETQFVDPVINVFVSPEDRQRTVQAAKATQAKRAQAEPARQEEAAQPKREGVDLRKKTGTENEDFEAKLREIRQINEEIQDKAVSDRIDRIGELTASIFRVVREKPEHAEEVRRFMNYYLPTTQKLMDTYRMMMQAENPGENIAHAMQSVENSLDMIANAFEKQLDNLFSDHKLDIETDIDVLETMMAGDGLIAGKYSRNETAQAGN